MNLKINFIVFALISFAIKIDAQSKLDKLSFDVPKYLISPKTEWSNVRKQPSKNALATKKLKRTGSNMITQMVPAYDYNGEWYKVNGGYAFKTAYVKSKLSPLTKEMFLPNFYSYCENLDCKMEWFVADKVGNHELALMFIVDNCNGFTHGFYLGKRIGNVLVFKYHLDNFNIAETDYDPNNISLTKEMRNGVLEYTLYLGRNFYVNSFYDEGFKDWVRRPNLYKFTDKLIEKFFGEQIDKGPNADIYITAECFPAEGKNIFDI